jgi:hypothetical protein
MSSERANSPDPAPTGPHPELVLLDDHTYIFSGHEAYPRTAGTRPTAGDNPWCVVAVLVLVCLAVVVVRLLLLRKG